MALLAPVLVLGFSVPVVLALGCGLVALALGCGLVALALGCGLVALASGGSVSLLAVVTQLPGRRALIWCLVSLYFILCRGLTCTLG
jgi:hypothetical protein